ncbi:MULTISPECIES: hypothetical protein [Streptomyces]|uniref:Uncharacterized protein n=1 Tax=Streptomyces canarius TaxID=285453 RepID=A0ABQ3CXV8_9ACTN|nr:hypothetical protein [Streptomyces canarius]GHA46439.1 hypothetical protein GCM10010345_58700 [Streptomyces canarius]
MTRPVVSPDELDPPVAADPRPRAERDLTEVWRQPRAARTLHRQQPRADRPGSRVLRRHADATAGYRDGEHVPTERGNALENLVIGRGPVARAPRAVTAGSERTRPRDVRDAACAPRTPVRVRQHSPRRTVDGLPAAPDRGRCRMNSLPAALTPEGR